MALNQLSKLFHKLNPHLNPTFLSDTINLIRSCYTERHRHYHNFFHLSECVKEAEVIEGKFSNYDAALFALIYHDLYWIPNSKTNEEMSADRAYYDAHQLGMSKDFCNTVRSLILSTRHNSTDVDNLDTALVRDIDFCILGKDPGHYLCYESGVKLEYTSFFDKNHYLEGRVKFLEMILRRKHIFFTNLFQDRYAEQARKNIRTTLACFENNDFNLTKWMLRY